MLRFFPFIFFCQLLVACKTDKNHYLAHTPVDINLVRYDKLLFEGTKTIEQLIVEYPQFSNIYINQIIAPVKRSPEDTDKNILRTFSEIPQIKALYDTAQIILGNLNFLENDLEQAIGNLSYILPDQKTPTFFTYLSEFGVGVFNYEDNIVGIGLDFFLGKDFPYPDPSLFPYYIPQNMDKKHITRRAIQVLLEDRIAYPPQDRMIDLMCRNGKVLYLLEKSIGFEPDSVIFSIPQKKLDWMIANEADIWTFFMGENLLYETNFLKIQKYISPAPHSPGMPDEAPGETANYIGYRIIKTILDKGDITIDQVLQIEDGQRLLEMARYKPR